MHRKIDFTRFLLTGHQKIDSDRKEYLKSSICSWDFLPLDLDNKDLIQIVFMILNQVLENFEELKPLRVPSGKVVVQNTWTP